MADEATAAPMQQTAQTGAEQTAQQATAPQQTQTAVPPEAAAETKPMQDPLPMTEPGKPEKEAEPEQKPEGAPESYDDFKMAEGFEAMPETIEEFKALAKEAGLSQEKAQKFIDLQMKASAKANEVTLQKFDDFRAKSRNDDLAALRADPEMGGGKYGETVANANYALQRIKGGEELRKLFIDCGMECNPKVNIFLARVGAMMREDGFVDAKNANMTTPKSAADVLFS